MKLDIALTCSTLADAVTVTCELLYKRLPTYLPACPALSKFI